jgi:hypothetical protein
MKSVPRALFLLSLWERLGEGPDEVGLATGSYALYPVAIAPGTDLISADSE